MVLILQEFKTGRPQSGINIFAAMKSRVKKVDSSGRSAPIPSQKAQKILVCSAQQAFICSINWIEASFDTFSCFYVRMSTWH